MQLDIDVSRFAGALVGTLLAKAIEMLRASPSRPPEADEPKPPQRPRRRKRTPRKPPPSQ